jgi:hypothetical protein
LVEHEARSQKRHGIVLERMAKKHAREVQIEVEKETVQIAGELKGQTRIARQAEVGLQRGQAEITELQQGINRAVQEKTEALKRIGRERRQHDVDVMQLKEKCGNLEASVRLRDKQEEGKKRQHKEAMAKAEDLCATLETKIKGVDAREGQLRYQRAKARRQMMVDKEAVNILKWGVEREQSLVDRRAASNTERTDTLRSEEATLCKKRDRLGKEKLVWFCPLLLTFYSLAFPVD